MMRRRCCCGLALRAVFISSQSRRKKKNKRPVARPGQRKKSGALHQRSSNQKGNFSS